MCQKRGKKKKIPDYTDTKRKLPMPYRPKCLKMVVRAITFYRTQKQKENKGEKKTCQSTLTRVPAFVRILGVQCGIIHGYRYSYQYKQIKTSECLVFSVLVDGCNLLFVPSQPEMQHSRWWITSMASMGSHGTPLLRRRRRLHRALRRWRPPPPPYHIHVHIHIC